MHQFDNLDQLRQLPRLPARLVFDEPEGPPPGGARRPEPTGRHLRYETEDLWLDLRLDQPPGSTESVLVGQLANRLDPLRSLAGMPVFLVAGEKLLARTISNRVGDFEVRYQPEGAPSLCLPFGNERLIEVPADPQDR